MDNKCRCIKSLILHLNLPIHRHNGDVRSRTWTLTTLYHSTVPGSFSKWGCEEFIDSGRGVDVGVELCAVLVVLRYRFILYYRMDHVDYLGRLVTRMELMA